MYAHSLVWLFRSSTSSFACAVAWTSSDGQLQTKSPAAPSGGSSGHRVARQVRGRVRVKGCACLVGRWSGSVGLVLAGIGQAGSSASSRAKSPTGSGRPASRPGGRRTGRRGDDVRRLISAAALSDGSLVSPRQHPIPLPSSSSSWSLVADGRQCSPLVGLVRRRLVESSARLPASERVAGRAGDARAVSGLLRLLYPLRHSAVLPLVLLGQTRLQTRAREANSRARTSDTHAGGG